MKAFRNFLQVAKGGKTLLSGWSVSRKHQLHSSSKKRGFGVEEFISTSEQHSHPTQSSYPLTKEEAFTFLESNLGIPQSQIDTGGKSLDFLNRVIKEMNKVLPFTNINLLTERPLSNLKPEDWKYHIMSGQGGTCRWINPFMKALLEQIGYISIQIPGNSPARDEVNPTHISTLVRDVSKPGSHHLVDCGTRQPFSEAIPIDFATESPEYTSYDLRGKFFKKDNDFLHLCIPASCEGPEKYVMWDSSGAKWQTRIVYWINERMEWTEFNESFIQAHDKDNISVPKPFDSLLFYGFTNEKRVSIVCSDGQIHTTFYSLEDQTTERKIMTKTELLDFFVHHFPQYSVKKLEKACEISKLV